MPTHAEQRLLPYTPRQLFDLVADVERYPEFLPWCVASRITRREGNVLYADLVVGFSMAREKFTSKVTLAPPGENGSGRIDVTYLDGPFRYLNNHWIFDPAGESSCRIDFYIDFAFHSAFLQRIMGALFNEAVRRMVSAFETRARRVYGPGAQTAPP
ncbi:MAG TPA: type II toxin-antitoxin system RatA family toxin [Alphaproteobacteria bacterium]|jgi:coenzyme Q-binding protein COQ10|nr:type II toxin-antitoxin system RatA family toxin [Alphaproteobacteria bacterium]